MSDFDNGPFVRERNARIASTAIKAVRREDTPALIAEALVDAHGQGLARSILEAAINHIGRRNDGR